MWVLLAVMCAAALVAWAASSSARRVRRLRAAELSGDDQCCWLCGGNVVRVAPDAYRCERCQNLQGTGVQVLRDAARRRELLLLPEAERRQRARRATDAAKLELIAAEGELSNVLQMSLDGLHGDGHESERADLAETMRRFADAVSVIGRVEQKLADAAVLLADDREVQRLQVDLASPHMLIHSLNIRHYGSVGGPAAHADIAAAIAHLPELDATLRQLERKLG